jgi:hypothetical protein
VLGGKDFLAKDGTDAWPPIKTKGLFPTCAGVARVAGRCATVAAIWPILSQQARVRVVLYSSTSSRSALFVALFSASGERALSTPVKILDSQHSTAHSCAVRCAVVTLLCCIR